jgi:hypothetical protein
LYRLGSISIEEIESNRTYSNKKQQRKCTQCAWNAVTTLCSKDKTILVDDAELELKKYPNAKVGLLVFQDTITNLQHVVTEILSKKEI